jgi:hypothetical protein
MELASGEFLLIATCDDTMRADFLATLLEAFAICPEAGIAAGDVSLINRDGGQLTREDMVSYLPAESLDDMLALDVVRSYPITRNSNYRPPQHHCLLHFSAKSVYRFGLARASDKPRRNNPCTEKADTVALSRKPTRRAPGELASRLPKSNVRTCVTGNLRATSFFAYA